DGDGRRRWSRQKDEHLRWSWAPSVAHATEDAHFCRRCSCSEGEHLGWLVSTLGRSVEAWMAATTATHRVHQGDHRHLALAPRVWTRPRAYPWRGGRWPTRAPPPWLRRECPSRQRADRPEYPARSPRPQTPPKYQHAVRR